MRENILPPAVIIVGIGAVIIFLSWAFVQQDDGWKSLPAADKLKNPVAVIPESIATGKIIYTKQCLSCHGKSGKGDGAAAVALEKHPGDLSSVKVHQQTDGALFWKITEGKKPMPTFKTALTEEQRWQVVNYIRTFYKPQIK